jgi:hypothetical protein
MTAPGTGKRLWVFHLTVRDNDGLESTDQVEIIVQRTAAPEGDHSPPTPRRTRRAENVPPVARAGLAQCVRRGDDLVLDASASYDPDGDGIVAYEWTASDRGYPGPALSVTTTEPRLTVDFATYGRSVLMPGNSLVALRVRDPRAGEDRCTVGFYVAPADVRIPRAEAGPDQTITKGEILVLDGSGSRDPDGRIVRYSWSRAYSGDIAHRLGTAAAATLRVDTGEVTWMKAGETYPIALFVTDNDGVYHGDVMQLHVREGTTRAPAGDRARKALRKGLRDTLRRRR